VHRAAALQAAKRPRPPAWGGLQAKRSFAFAVLVRGCKRPEAASARLRRAASEAELRVRRAGARLQAARRPRPPACGGLQAKRSFAFAVLVRGCRPR